MTFRQPGSLDKHLRRASGITIVIEFESKDAARRFYESPQYTAARDVRALAADTDLMLVDGL